MTSSRCEHFVKGELSVKVSLNDINPVWLSRLVVQLLKHKILLSFGGVLTFVYLLIQILTLNLKVFQFLNTVNPIYSKKHISVSTS